MGALVLLAICILTIRCLLRRKRQISSAYPMYGELVVKKTLATGLVISFAMSDSRLATRCLCASVVHDY